jgi:hypothetical protein
MSFARRCGAWSRRTRRSPCSSTRCSGCCWGIWRPGSELRRPPGVKFNSLAPLIPDCVGLLSTLAHVGQSDEAEAETAFAAGIRTLGIPDGKVALLSIEQSGYKVVDAALDRLALGLARGQRACAGSFCCLRGRGRPGHDRRSRTAADDRRFARLPHAPDSRRPRRPRRLNAQLRRRRKKRAIRHFLRMIHQRGTEDTERTIRTGSRIQTVYGRPRSFQPLAIDWFHPAH